MERRRETKSSPPESVALDAEWDDILQDSDTYVSDSQSDQLSYLARQVASVSTLLVKSHKNMQEAAQWDQQVYELNLTAITTCANMQDAAQWAQQNMQDATQWAQQVYELNCELKVQRFSWEQMQSKCIEAESTIQEMDQQLRGLRSECDDLRSQSTMKDAKLSSMQSLLDQVQLELQRSHMELHARDSARSWTTKQSWDSPGSSPGSHLAPQYLAQQPASYQPQQRLDSFGPSPRHLQAQQQPSHQSQQHLDSPGSSPRHLQAQQQPSHQPQQHLDSPGSSPRHRQTQPQTELPSPAEHGQAQIDSPSPSPQDGRTQPQTDSSSPAENAEKTVHSLEAKLNVEKTVHSLETELKAEKGRAQELQALVSRLEEIVKGGHGQVDGLRTLVAELEETVQATSGQVGSLQAELKDEKGRAQKLRCGLEAELNAEKESVERMVLTVVAARQSECDKAAQVGAPLEKMLEAAVSRSGAREQPSLELAMQLEEAHLHIQSLNEEIQEEMERRSVAEAEARAKVGAEKKLAEAKGHILSLLEEFQDERERREVAEKKLEGQRQFEGLLKVSERRLEAHASRVRQLEIRLKHMEGEAVEGEDERSRMVDNQYLLKEETADLQAQLAAAEARLEEAERKVEEADRRLDTQGHIQVELAAAEARVEEAERKPGEIERRLHTQGHIQKKLAAADARVEEAERKLEEAGRKLAAAEARVEETAHSEEQLKEAEARLEEAAQIMEELEEAAGKLQSEGRLQAEADMALIREQLEVVIGKLEAERCLQEQVQKTTEDALALVQAQLAEAGRKLQEAERNTEDELALVQAQLAEAGRKLQEAERRLLAEEKIQEFIQVQLREADGKQRREWGSVSKRINEVEGQSADLRPEQLRMRQDSAIEIEQAEPTARSVAGGWEGALKGADPGLIHELEDAFKRGKREHGRVELPSPSQDGLAQPQIDSRSPAEEAEKKVHSLEVELKAEKGRTHGLQALVSRLEERVKGGYGQVDGLRALVVELEQNVQEANGQVGSLQAELEVEHVRVADIQHPMKEETAGLQAQLAAAEARLEEADRKVEEAERKLEADRHIQDELVAAEARVEQAERKLEQECETRQDGECAVKYLEERLREENEQVQSLQSDLTMGCEAREALEAKFRELGQEKLMLEGRFQSLVTESREYKNGMESLFQSLVAESSVEREARASTKRALEAKAIELEEARLEVEDRLQTQAAELSVAREDIASTRRALEATAIELERARREVEDRLQTQAAELSAACEDREAGQANVRRLEERLLASEELVRSLQADMDLEWEQRVSAEAIAYMNLEKEQRAYMDLDREQRVSAAAIAYMNLEREQRVSAEAITILQGTEARLSWGSSPKAEGLGGDETQAEGEAVSLSVTKRLCGVWEQTQVSGACFDVSPVEPPPSVCRPTSQPTSAYQPTTSYQPISSYMPTPANPSQPQPTNLPTCQPGVPCSSREAVPGSSGSASTMLPASSNTAANLAELQATLLESQAGCSALEQELAAVQELMTSWIEVAEGSCHLELRNHATALDAGSPNEATPGSKSGADRSHATNHHSNSIAALVSSLQHMSALHLEGGKDAKLATIRRRQAHLQHPDDFASSHELSPCSSINGDCIGSHNFNPTTPQALCLTDSTHYSNGLGKQPSTKDSPQTLTPPESFTRVAARYEHRLYAEHQGMDLNPVFSSNPAALYPTHPPMPMRPTFTQTATEFTHPAGAFTQTGAALHQPAALYDNHMFMAHLDKEEFGGGSSVSCRRMSEDVWEGETESSGGEPRARRHGQEGSGRNQGQEGTGTWNQGQQARHSPSIDLPQLPHNPRDSAGSRELDPDTLFHRNGPALGDQGAWMNTYMASGLDYAGRPSAKPSAKYPAWDSQEDLKDLGSMWELPASEPPPMFD
eukprot:gene18607-25121_t